MKKQKIELVVTDLCTYYGMSRPCLFGALLAAQNALDFSVANNKTHVCKHAIEEVWAKQSARLATANILQDV
jgi:hypothetical protein